MDKQDFFKLTLEEQIDFFNSNLKNGASITSVCNDLNISKSIVIKFKFTVELDLVQPLICCVFFNIPSSM